MTKLSAPSILIADAEPLIRELLTDLLRKTGCTVHEAANGKEVMRCIGRHAVDIIIIDLVMSEQDGLETIRQLRVEFPHIRVIAISGFERGGSLRHARLFGVDAVLPKPFCLDEMSETVASLF